MVKLQKLPIGIQTFETIRNDGYLYVDKTKYLIDLIDRGAAYFLSRPRRFGKSLTISTFDALFSGKKELFKGLAAEEFFERPDYKTYPIIRLDMSNVTMNMGTDILVSSMMDRMSENAKKLGVEAKGASPGNAFYNLLVSAAEKYNKPVVVLVDEYDSPMLSNIDDANEVEKARRILRDIYMRIKAGGPYIRFVFITGISKFSKVGVFSALNNLKDISMSDDYAAMLGLTEEELLSNFGDYIDMAALDMEMSKEELAAKIKNYYDGFSFNGKIRLYNPFSTLCFLSDREFRRYWFESGTTSFIANYMKNKKLTVEQFRGYEVPYDFASNPGEIETATAASFLYQAGYLSLRPGVLLDYSLDYPNHEVLTAMSSLLVGNILGDNAELYNSAKCFIEFFVSDDAPGVQEEFNKLLSKIPYDDYAKAAAGAVPRGGDAREWIYRSTLLSYIYGMGLDVEAELHGKKGRADMVVKFKGHIWVMELKMTKHYANATECAASALAQIKEKGYADAFDEAMLFGLAIDDNEQKITAISAEKKIRQI
ncbi:ATPase AAA [Synergistales bacterium]|nr:ATPase AAA [Synergistales bacterium]